MRPGPVPRLLMRPARRRSTRPPSARFPDGGIALAASGQLALMQAGRRCVAMNVHEHSVGAWSTDWTSRIWYWDGHRIWLRPRLQLGADRGRSDSSPSRREFVCSTRCWMCSLAPAGDQHRPVAAHLHLTLSLHICSTHNAHTLRPPPHPCSPPDCYCLIGRSEHAHSERPLAVGESPAEISQEVEFRLSEQRGVCRSASLGEPPSLACRWPVARH